LREALGLHHANMLGHSTTLGARLVSPINPRVIFNEGEVADVSTLSRAQLVRAIDRLKRPAGDPLRMPPRDARTLDDGGRERLIEHFRGLDERP